MEKLGDMDDVQLDTLAATQIMKWSLSKKDNQWTDIYNNSCGHVDDWSAVDNPLHWMQCWRSYFGRLTLRENHDGSFTAMAYGSSYLKPDASITTSKPGRAVIIAIIAALRLFDPNDPGLYPGKSITKEQ